MVTIPAGLYRLGSDDHYPEERPAREGLVAAFRLDRTPVTNAAFARFVAQTGYVTLAERADPAGAAVFVPTPGPVDLHNPAQWWRFVPGACWRRPGGPGTSIEGRDDLPVVQVVTDDAKAFAAWAGKRLPTEAEWEAAARGRPGAGTAFAWGDRFMPGGQLMANVWTGAFPWYFARGGTPGPGPVGSFPADALGLFDMIGNVWEMTTTPFDRQDHCGCGSAGRVRVVAKGGSFLCAGDYCARYRPAARIGVAPDSPACNIGFRCAADIAPA